MKIRHFFLFPLMAFLVMFTLTWGYEVASFQAARYLWNGGR